jgi:hypothetical protein
MNKEQKCVELLQRGVQFKRSGDLEQALNYCRQANHFKT